MEDIEKSQVKTLSDRDTVITLGASVGFVIGTVSMKYFSEKFSKSNIYLIGLSTIIIGTAIGYFTAKTIADKYFKE